MEATIYNEPIIFDCRIESKAAALFRTITWKDKKYINSECSKLLDELNLTFYSDIIFAMQAESDLVGMTPVQRSKLFREIFNFKFEEELSKLDSDIENAKNNINVLTGKIEVAQSSLKSLDLNNNFNEVPLPFTEEEYNNKLKEIDLLEESIENSNNTNEVFLKKFILFKTINIFINNLVYIFLIILLSKNIWENNFSIGKMFLFLSI